MTVFAGIVMAKGEPTWLSDFVDRNGIDAGEVLVVVDAQTDFVDGALANEQAQANVVDLAEAVAGADGLVIGTLDTHQADYMDTQEGRNLPVPHCEEHTEGWLPHPTVLEALVRRQERLGVAVPMFRKPTFGSTRLAEQLSELAKDHDVRRIRFVGYCTDICVVSNALLVKAFLPETEIVCEAWACAGVTPDAHEAALTVMESCQVKVNRERPAGRE